MLMKDSTAVRNQWLMPVNLRGGNILFDLWSNVIKAEPYFYSTSLPED